MSTEVPVSHDYGARTAHSFISFRRSACYMRLNIGDTAMGMQELSFEGE